MKKIFIALMAVTLFVGCAKESENVETPALKVVFSVADKVGLEADTKAIKNSWTDGDQILLLFQPDGQSSLLPFENNSNSIKLTYNGGKWKASDFNGDAASLSTNGYYSGVYHYGEVSFGAADNSKVFLKNYIGGDYLECYGSYTISDGAIDLGTISMTRSAHAYMISVRNLASVDGPWTLTVGDNNNLSIMLRDVALNAGGLMKRIDDAAYERLRLMANYVTAGGVVNGTDISFCFDKGSDYTGDKYYFTISNGVDTYEFVKYGVTNETLQAGKAYYLPSIGDPRWTEK